MEDNNMQTRKPNYLALSAMLAGIPILIFIIFGIKNLFSGSTTTIKLLFTPASAIATIDGKEYASGNIVLAPGVHEITVKKYGFQEQTKTLETKAGQTTSAYFILMPTEDFTMDWYKFHENDGRLSEGITSYAAEEENEKILKNFPVVKKLPVKNDNFNIYRQYSCDNDTICIFIQAKPDKRNEAISYFKKNLDADVGKYSFIFEDYVNPFGEEG